MHCFNVRKTGERRNENTCLQKNHTQMCEYATELVPYNRELLLLERPADLKYFLLSLGSLKLGGWSSSFMNQHKALFPHKPHTMSHPYTMRKNTNNTYANQCAQSHRAAAPCKTFAGYNSSVIL